MDRDTIIVSADFEEGCVGVCPDEFFTFFVIIISILYDFTYCFVWPNSYSCFLLHSSYKYMTLVISLFSVSVFANVTFVL